MLVGFGHNSDLLRKEYTHISQQSKSMGLKKCATLFPLAGLGFCVAMPDTGRRERSFIPFATVIALSCLINK